MNHTNIHRNALIAAGAASALAGFVVQAGVQPMTTVSEDMWSYPWTADTLVWIALAWAALHAVAFVGLLGLPRSRGLYVALAGTAVLLLAELLSIPIRDVRTDADAAGGVAAVFGLGTALSAGGLIAVGLRAGGTLRPAAIFSGVALLSVFALVSLVGPSIGIALYGLGLIAMGTALEPAPALREQLA
ncbi:hypothetical protein OJ998_07305 [Solirubrobacter taibaiensis]|nr:hypothetical protein [Solirubrobacter taibaiensis]